MSIRINYIHLVKHGPLGNFKLPLRQLNLIYGLNESGKTYLVEFIIQSLFRYVKNWDIRDGAAEGNLEVIGLNEESVSFSPASNKKIEDYWGETRTGLPLNMNRLLVVKGGELALSSESLGGVNRNDLKTALTSQALLDDLWDSIQPTVRKSTLEAGQIIGSNMGKIKDRNLLQKDLNELRKLIENINSSYSRGPARQIELALKQNQDQLEIQEKAKAHLAFLYLKELQEINSQKSLIAEDQLYDQKDRIRDYTRLKSDIGSLKDRMEEIKAESRGFSWLESAIDIWEGKGLDDKKSAPKIIGAAGLLSLASGLIIMILEYYLVTAGLFWFGAALSGVGLGLVIYYAFRLFTWINQLDDSKERKSIQAQFLDRFGTTPQNLADLKEQKNKLQEKFIAGRTTKKMLEEKANQLDLESQTIEYVFNQMTGRPVPPEDWDRTIQELTNRLQGLSKEILRLERNLSQLDVAEKDIRVDPVETDFSPAVVASLLENNSNLKNDLAMYHKELDTLKARACERTGDEITEPWPDIYFRLITKEQELTSDYQELTAEIIAEIGLTEILTRLREEEDQKINQALNAEEVSRLIYQLTGRYLRLDLVDNQIYVFDEFNRYALQNLSTGAREQILLAMRLGMATRISSGKPLFLILDDAFQHSDWQRREVMVDTTIELARDGWQIIYLSMDDHIKDLFTKKAKPILRKDFQLVELS